MTTGLDKVPLVVVGIDGSPNSVAALRWAFRYAVATKARLKAVAASNPHMGFGFAPISIGDFEREAHHTLDRAIKRALGDHPAVPIETEAMHQDAVAALLEASNGADLLVVGDRGVGGFAGLLLGSVSRRCVRQAHCSVVVVRGSCAGAVESEIPRSVA